MKKIIFSILSILVTLCASAQVNLVKVADYFDDFEITNFSTYYDTIYNNGNDITMSVNVRFKLKNPFGATNLIPNGSRIAIYYEPVNGNNIRTTINEIILDGPWQPPIGGIYSPYMPVNVTIPKEYLLSGNLRTYFISPNDPVANYWGYGISVAAKSTRKLTVVNVPNFIGPSQLCGEATYTIERPGMISLENAAGVATLTSLGNNQWKVTRTGTGTGIVKLRSTSNGKIYDKDIDIGTIAKGSISGNAVLQLGESQTYTLALNGNTDYNWSVTYNPNVTLTKLSATSIKLSTTGSVPMGWSENITISAQAVGSCGTSSNYISKTIKFVNERDPRLD